MITFRQATPDDIPMLARWAAAPHVRAALGEEAPPDWDADLAQQNDWQEALIAETDGRPVGYFEIIDPAMEPSHYWGDVEQNLRAFDIWIGDADDLGKGYGAEMVRLGLDRCFAPTEITAVIIDPLVSNVRAIKFYKRFGFQHVGVQHFDGNDCAVMKLERKEWECRNLI